jgi:hypothetical protein
MNAAAPQDKAKKPFLLTVTTLSSFCSWFKARVISADEAVKKTAASL